MSARKRQQAALIATLGSEPQVVTIVLDRLLAQGCAIDEVTVVHTGAPVVQAALERVAAEFRAGTYPGVSLRPAAVSGPAGIIADLQTEEDMWALLRVLYREVRRARRDGRTVHLCVSGGRKAMGIAGMVAAQLLFGADDRVWHLISEGWQPGGERRMHLPPEERVWLVSVPVLRWTSSAAMLAALGSLEDPAEAIRCQEMLERGQTMRRRQEFLEHWLTEAEREVVRLACAGLDNAAIAARLHKSERTVANQLTSVYGKLHEWLDYPARLPDRSVLIAEFAPYYALEGKMAE